MATQDAEIQDQIIAPSIPAGIDVKRPLNVTAVPAPLPPGWFEMVDPAGRTLYCNPTSGQSSWERPVVKQLPPGWVKSQTPDGREIFIHPESKICSYQFPAQPVATGPKPQPQSPVAQIPRQQSYVQQMPQATRITSSPSIPTSNPNPPLIRSNTMPVPSQQNESLLTIGVNTAAARKAVPGFEEAMAVHQLSQRNNSTVLTKQLGSDMAQMTTAMKDVTISGASLAVRQTKVASKMMTDPKMMSKMSKKAVVKTGALGVMTGRAIKGIMGEMVEAADKKGKYAPKHREFVPYDGQLEYKAQVRIQANAQVQNRPEIQNLQYAQGSIQGNSVGGAIGQNQVPIKPNSATQNPIPVLPAKLLHEYEYQQHATMSTPNSHASENSAPPVYQATAPLPQVSHGSVPARKPVRPQSALIASNTVMNQVSQHTQAALVTNDVVVNQISQHNQQSGVTQISHLQNTIESSGSHQELSQQSNNTSIEIVASAAVTSTSASVTSTHSGVPTHVAPSSTAPSTAPLSIAKPPTAAISSEGPLYGTGSMEPVVTANSALRPQLLHPNKPNSSNSAQPTSTLSIQAQASLGLQATTDVSSPPPYTQVTQKIKPRPSSTQPASRPVPQRRPAPVGNEPRPAYPYMQEQPHSHHMTDQQHESHSIVTLPDQYSHTTQLGHDPHHAIQQQYIVQEHQPHQSSTTDQVMLVTGAAAGGAVGGVVGYEAYTMIQQPQYDPSTATYQDASMYQNQPVTQNIIVEQNQTIVQQETVVNNEVVVQQQQTVVDQSAFMQTSNGMTAQEGLVAEAGYAQYDYVTYEAGTGEEMYAEGDMYSGEGYGDPGYERDAAGYDDMASGEC